MLGFRRQGGGLGMFFKDVAIRVDAISKRFELYSHPRDQLKQILLPTFQRILGLSEQNYFKEFWALRNVSLEVNRGQSCGIVGLNGSGKSTLLQIIAGTLSPTSGQVSIEGRVSALLELGSGFNPEFTGRENVFMNGAVLGFSREQVKEKLEDIESFADIADHFDKKLSTYSSGMQMRVAFAVATAFDPDILIVDEALAVGDAFFQQKCFHRIEKFKEGGGTMLFVSHDANIVKHLCDKAILINQGVAAYYGEPREVIDLYQGLIAQKSDMGKRDIVISQHQKTQSSWTKATTITTNNDAELISFKLIGVDTQPVVYVESDTQLTVEYVVKLNKTFDRPAFGLIIRDRLGRSIFETSTYAMRMPETPIASGMRVLVRFLFNFNLCPGQYSFSIGVANRGYDRSEFEEYSLLMHDVEQLQVGSSPTAAYYGGIFDMKPTVSVSVIGQMNV